MKKRYTEEQIVKILKADHGVSTERQATQFVHSLLDRLRKNGPKIPRLCHLHSAEPVVLFRRCF